MKYPSMQAGVYPLGPNEVSFVIGFVVLLILLGPELVKRLFEGNGFHEAIIDRHRNKLRAESIQQKRGAGATAARGSLLAIGRYVSAFLPTEILKEKKRVLRQAGFAQDYSLAIFLGVKATMIVVSFVGSIFVFFVDYDFLWLNDVALALFCSSVLIFFGVDIFVSSRKRSRMKKLEANLPNCLDLLVICAEAGLSLDASLKRVAEEFVDVAPEMSEELLLTAVELNFLPQRRQALVNLSSRVDVPAYRGVTTALIQTEKYGTPLANALRTLSSDFRETSLLRAEEKAARLPAILTVPMICFILPALFIVLAGPAFIGVMEKIG